MFERRERITAAEVLKASMVYVRPYTRKGKQVNSYLRKGVERNPQPKLDELLRTSKEAIKEMNRKYKEEAKARHKALKEGWSVKEILKEWGGADGNFFHGTTDAVLSQILQEGIIPGGHKRVWGNDFYNTKDRAESVFLVTDETYAKTWCMEALRRLGGKSAIIFKVSLPEEERLKEDTAAGNRHYLHVGAIKPEWIKGYIKIKATVKTFKDPWGDQITRVGLQHDQAKYVQIRSAASRTYYIPVIIFER